MSVFPAKCFFAPHKFWKVHFFWTVHFKFWNFCRNFFKTFLFQTIFLPTNGFLAAIEECQTYLSVCMFAQPLHLRTLYQLQTPQNKVTSSTCLGTGCKPVLLLLVLLSNLVRFLTQECWKYFIKILCSQITTLVEDGSGTTSCF